MVIINPFFPLNHGLATAAYYHCYSTSNFTSGKEYGNNRNAFLSSIPTDVSNRDGFFYAQSVSYTSTSDVLHCLGLCRADLIASDACSICISNSSSTITTNCPVQMEVIAWGEDAGCVVRCAPHDFPNKYETQPVVHVCNSIDVSISYIRQFDHTLSNLTHSIAASSVDYGSKHSFSSDGIDMPKYFATQEEKLGEVDVTIYALGFCLPTLSPNACDACLQTAANQSKRLCSGKTGATIFMPSCILRYELYRFYKASSIAVLPSPPPLSPQVSNIKKESKSLRKFVPIIVLPVIVVLAVMTLISCTVNHLLNKRKRNKEDEDDQTVGGAESSESCLEFSFNTIRVATNDFSSNNKLGQGGFGAVYKGRLPNGRLIAVKRLAVHSGRRIAEFKNEVRLVARLHHKNLIRLIGFCSRGKDRILIYELALNGSLDCFLFDPIKREKLTWEVRFNIIQGIARGMLYLHEESSQRIIHRDLKASNVLLNESFTPKISDFGTAKLFVEDQGSASRIVGTYGYMAPEYVKYGKLSVKIDVFSFGVMLLEIVSGKKNSASEDSQRIDHLLSKAWIYWAERKLLKLIDPILLRASDQTDEITKCIHIGLLCIQENAADRPSMDSVSLMLETEGCSKTLPPPSKPAYFMKVDTRDDEPNWQVIDQQRSASFESHQMSVSSFSLGGFSSANEVSITQPYPGPR